MTEINNMIEDIAEYLFEKHKPATWAKWRDYENEFIKDAYREEARQISQLFPQPLTDEADPQAELFGWFLDHGWTPPGELQQKIEKHYKIGHYDGESAGYLKGYQDGEKQERKEVGEWLLDEYEATPRGKRIALFETAIEKLIAGQSLDGDEEDKNG